MMLLDVPQYCQSKADYSCGPVAIRMIADYYYKKENKEMTAAEWLTILKITMNNNIWRISGTKKEDIRRALARLKFDTKTVKGTDFKSKLDSIRKAISKKHPVLIYCVIKPDKPYRHFAVVAGFENNSIYVRDPYPRERNTKKPRRISLDAFAGVSPPVGGLAWGRKKWGIEVIKN
jgi:uncharacterized protein YvpB